MRWLALLLTGALLAAAPAHADFFDDLGDALSKAGDAIGDAANDVGNAVDDAFSSKPANNQQQKPAETGNKPGDITWNPPPPTTGFSGATVYTPGNVPLPRSAPARRRASPSEPAFPNTFTGTVDDAPPPRRAPHRANVEASYIAPLPGFEQAPPRPAAHYSPVLAAASLSAAPAADIPTPARLPAVKPVVVQNRSFAITFGRDITTVSDTLLQVPGQRASGTTKALIEAVTKSLASNPDQRLKLHAEAVVEENRLSEARRRSFDRALLVKRWLVDAGVRSTRIDLDVAGAGNADAVTLTVYND